MRNLNDFISKVPCKTPPMAVTVYDKDDKVYGKFDVPSGFQLERYVGTLYPENEIMMTLNNVDFVVSVFEDEQIIATYRGIYK